MTDPPPLIGLTAAALATNFVGCLLSLWLIAQAWGDFRAAQLVKAQSDRQYVGIYSIFAETVRFIIQATFIGVRFPLLFTDPDVYAGVVNAIWLQVLVRTGGDLVIAILLMAKSLGSLWLRNKLVRIQTPSALTDYHHHRRENDLTATEEE